MNDLTETLIADFRPIMAVTVYKNEKVNDYYLESHDINTKGELGAGKPIQQETLQEVVNVFFDERKNMSTIGGIVPENLLSYQLMPGGNYKLIWYNPAQIRVIHHSSGLKLPTAKSWVPSIVYVVEQNNLNVYAINTIKRPEEKTILYMAPFFNVNDLGDVCLGNAKVKKPKDKTFKNVIKYWEDLFWLSEFTHVNGDQKVKSKNLQVVWKKMMGSKTKLKWSDINELITAKKTLKDIL